MTNMISGICHTLTHPQQHLCSKEQQRRSLSSLNADNLVISLLLFGLSVCSETIEFPDITSNTESKVIDEMRRGEALEALWSDFIAETEGAIEGGDQDILSKVPGLFVIVQWTF